MRDVLAVFNAQFHVTKGNIIEWSLKADPELSLDGVEFSVLPSGIHAVERDVVYFTIPNPSSSTHSPLHGVSIFRRLATTEEGQRGARLASLGAIVTPGAKPWRHVDRLKAVFEESLHNQDGKWDAPTAFFEEFRLVTEAETPSLSFQPSTSTSSADSISSLSSSPLNHLPHLLPILGPLSSTLHKHVLARRRILIYCKPPIEGACVLAWICGALACPLENVELDERSESLLDDVEELTSAPKGAKDKGIQVLGCITLNDMERLKEAGETGSGWVACTSDAIYLEKTDTFDLLIDLTTLKASPPPPTTNPGSTTTPAPPPGNRRLRPTFHTSHGGKLSQLRWGWSDIKPWTELDRIIALSPFRHEHHSHDSGAFCCNPNPPSSGSAGPGSGSQDKTKPLQGPWGDLWIWRIYEDVCLVCAGLFLGSSSSSSLSSTSRVQLSGDENPIYFSHVKTVGNGIQGGKPSKALKKGRRGSGMSVLLGNASEFAGVSSSSSADPSSPTSIGDNAGGASTSTEDNEEREERKRDSLRRTTTALLQSFHAQEMFLESTLKEVIALRTPSLLSSSPASSSAGSAATPAPTKVRRRVSLPPPSTSSPSTAPATGPVITILPKDLLTMSLNPWSTFDARFVEWFAESGDFGVGGGSSSGKVKVKKGWGAVVGVFLPG
ncbi:hypothetical protein DL96DRAFT_1819886 [Flagelloscypha sp. PMI_526]|nr:hypothetical protein DL96DRAFT_1819886 [Flagelloscypha sp. PMI_526]